MVTQNQNRPPSELAVVPIESPYHPTHVGKLAVVSLELAQRSKLALAEFNPESDDLSLIEDHEFKADINTMAAEQSLKDFRTALGEQTYAQKALFGKYCITSVPDILKNAKAVSGEDQPWSTWLSNGATDDEVFYFLKWHTKSVEDLQAAPEVAEEYVQQKQTYKQGIATGIEAGWLHPTAAAAIEEADTVSLVIGDVFETVVEGNAGYHTRGTDKIVIGQPDVIADKETTIGWQKQHIQAHTMHELNHAVLGELNARWLDEALTQHIAEVIKHGRLDVIDPFKREAEQRGVYLNERLLLKAVLEGKPDIGKPVPIELATLAYSDQSEEGDANVDLMEAVNEAWGYDGKDVRVLVMINARTASYETKLLESGYTSIQAGNEAAARTYEDLRDNPQELFGLIK